MRGAKVCFPPIADTSSPQHHPLIVSVGLIAMFIIPLVLHYIGTRNSDQELGYMLNFLAEHADANL